MDDCLFAIWMSLRCGAGNIHSVRLLEHFGTPYSVFGAGADELKESGIPDKLVQRLENKNLAEAYRILNYCYSAGVRIIVYGGDGYPKTLKSLRDAPLLLYCKGELPDLDRRLCISMVGKRDMSEYGMKIAYKIAYELASAGTVVVSGMALGIDGTAAGAAICAGGSTVAVLGCGIDIVYPSAHRNLLNNIIQNGAVITEYPPATPPAGYNFPVRNRIISGLSQGTLVVEANTESGAMITAKNAIMQGRDIFAIPGNIGQVNSTRTNQLIHDGATVVLRARDILENYAYMYCETIDMVRLTFAEKRSDPDISALISKGVCSRSEVILDTSRTYDNTLYNGNTQFGSPANIVCVASGKPVIKDYPDEKTEKQKPEKVRKTVPDKTGDESVKLLDTLNEKQKKIFDEIPDDKSISADALTKLGFSVGDVMSALTILEIKGLVQSLPGGLYSKV